MTAMETTSARIARVLGWTEGQVWTSAVGLLFACGLALAALPPLDRSTSALPERFDGVPSASAPEDDADVGVPPAADPGTGLPTYEMGPQLWPSVRPSDVGDGDGEDRRDGDDGGDDGDDDGAGDVPAPTGALVVEEAGWSSTLAGTPLVRVGIPPSGLPVTLRGGKAENVSYVRLSGGATTFTLAVSTEPGAVYLDEVASILLCPLTSDTWTGQPAMKAEEAPAYDCATVAVAGTRAADGTAWAFDLADVPDRTGDHGFALVPAAGGAPEFRVTFTYS